MTGGVSSPSRPSLSGNTKQLYENVREAIFALPQQFETDTQLEGIDVPDLFNINSLLAASIEREFVNTLNQMHDVWDPHEEYQDCAFVRQPQTFPDICLHQQSKPDDPPLLGIELKSWYLLSKEGEPSMRYKVTPSACAPQDMLVVVPWSLSEVNSGTPILQNPFVESARYASEYVDYYWTELRDTSQPTEIKRPSSVSPYPDVNSEIQDTPVSDSGGNYGRLARSGIMDAYVESQLETQLGGIRARDWIEFITEHSQ